MCDVVSVYSLTQNSVMTTMAARRLTWRMTRTLQGLDELPRRCIECFDGRICQEVKDRLQKGLLDDEDDAFNELDNTNTRQFKTPIDAADVNEYIQLQGALTGKYLLCCMCTLSSIKLSQPCTTPPLSGIQRFLPNWMLPRAMAFNS